MNQFEEMSVEADDEVEGKPTKRQMLSATYSTLSGLVASFRKMNKEQVLSRLNIVLSNIERVTDVELLGQVGLWKGEIEGVITDLKQSEGPADTLREESVISRLKDCAEEMEREMGLLH